MRPPECELCGAAPASDAGEGLAGFDVLAFADHQPLPEGMTGHPAGTPWLCPRHLAEAGPLTGLEWAAARDVLAARQPPADATPVRDTPTWDGSSMPDGLRRAHQVAEGVWARLQVTEGALTFAFEEPTEVEGPGAWLVRAGQAVVIPPGRPHHVDVDGPVQFHLTFLR